MLKISCRLSHFLTEWSFRAKVFPAPGSKNVLSYYSYIVRYFSNKNYFVFIVESLHNQRNFNFLLHDVLLFCSPNFCIENHDNNIEGLSNIEVFI